MKLLINTFYLRFKLLLGPDKDRYIVKDGMSRLRDRNIDLKMPLTASSGVALETRSPET